MFGCPSHEALTSSGLRFIGLGRRGVASIKIKKAWKMEWKLGLVRVLGFLL